MELGGNAPFLVFEDADVDAAVDGAMIAKMRNMGEACTAANRFLVHADVADEFAAELGERMGALTRRSRAGRRRAGRAAHRLRRRRLGQPAGHRRRSTTARRSSPAASAPPAPGHFYPPTVLIDVPAEAQINAVEVFGPVAPITTFTTEDEAIAAANDTEYGLVVLRLHPRPGPHAAPGRSRWSSAMIGINTGLVSNPAAPFGGVKASGFGREGGFEGIEEYLDTTYVALPAG